MHNGSPHYDAIYSKEIEQLIVEANGAQWNNFIGNKCDCKDGNMLHYEMPLQESLS